MYKVNFVLSDINIIIQLCFLVLTQFQFKMVRITDHFHCKYDHAKWFVIMFSNGWFQWYFGCSKEIHIAYTLLSFADFLWISFLHIQTPTSCQGINHHQGHPMLPTPIGTMENPDIGQAIDWFAQWWSRTPSMKGQTMQNKLMETLVLLWIVRAHCVVHHDVPGSPWKSWPTCSSTKTMRPCSQRLTIGLGSSLAAATKMVRPFWYQQMKDKKVSSDSMSAAQSAYMFVHWFFFIMMCHSASHPWPKDGMHVWNHHSQHFPWDVWRP